MYCVFFKEALAVIPFFIGIELIHKSSCSHPFDELPFFYYKRVIAATHSFKFTVFLQNRNCSKEILTIIIIPPWFQACIYPKKFLSWWHHFQPSIFSIIVPLFQGSTWRNPHVKETVFISQPFVQPSIIIEAVCGWFEKKLKSMFISGKPLWPCSFKGAYLFHRTSCNKYCI